MPRPPFDPGEAPSPGGPPGPIRTPGAPPGTLVYTGAARAAPVRVSAFRYGKEAFETFDVVTPTEAAALRSPGAVTWVNMDGVSDVDLVREMGSAFEIHRLVLEDVVNTTQRPKTEEYDAFLFVVLRMLRYQSGSLDEEQVSLILGDDFVISFQEHAEDVFEPVRKRLREGNGLIRARGADYLAYALIDAVVDHYFLVVEAIGDEVDVIEDQILENASIEVANQIHSLKRRTLRVRRAAWPLREALVTLYRDESPLVNPPTRRFFRDVYDHDLQVLDRVDSVREVLGASMDLFLSLQGHRMNEVMKVLTMIATVFIPLSFFAGLYGMNFQYMPELGFRWGYPTLLGLMVLMVVLMVIFFRRRKWL